MAVRPRTAWLPHSDNPAYAGVRLRCTLPVAVLRSQGLPVAIVDDLNGTPPDVAIIQAKWLLDAGELTRLTARLEAVQRWRDGGCRLLLDLFDNYFLNESGDPRRTELLTRLRGGLGLFDGFTVSSPGLVPYLRAEVGPTASVLVVGDPLEGPGAHRLYESPIRRANPTRWLATWRAWADDRNLAMRRRQKRQLLWFGNHGSSYAQGGMAELGRILGALEAAAARVPMQLTVVSNSEPRYREILGTATFEHRYRAWDRLHFASCLRGHDLVILPATITPFTASKSNNRLLLPLALGVPVIADALPDYLPWQEHFQLGGWERLAEILADLQPLQARAAAARTRIEEHYTPAAVARYWWSAIEEVAQIQRSSN
jgi:hypothetical protein